MYAVIGYTVFTVLFLLCLCYDLSQVRVKDFASYCYSVLFYLNLTILFLFKGAVRSSTVFKPYQYRVFARSFISGIERNAIFNGQGRTVHIQ